MSQVKYRTINDGADGQRIDNFLFKLLPGVPRTLIYRLLRQGQFRLNKKRIKASGRVSAGDILRIPPIQLESKPLPKVSFVPNILFEDDSLLIINKPSGLAVHGGSGLSWGLIELLRAQFEAENLSLVHRLDKDTSGVLVLAKTTKAMRDLSNSWADSEKIYSVLVQGNFAEKKVVEARLQKNILSSGERMVRVHPEGKESKTTFEPIEQYGMASLVKATLGTGRTHQIRVHAQSIGHPVVGDDKYGENTFNARLAKRGLKRLCLHALSISFIHPTTAERMIVEAGLPAEFQNLKEKL